MWKGKNKAITFSFDDGVSQDIRAIGILDKYGLKATFNINSGTLGTLHEHQWSGGTYRRDMVKAADVRKAYEGHEVAAHTIYHPNLVDLPRERIIAEVEGDRLALEDLVGYEVTTMAYPGGPINSDERVAGILREKSKIRFARTYLSNGGFELQDDLLLFRSTVYFAHKQEMFDLAEKFLSLKADRPLLFYIWGHTYELDIGCNINWDDFESFCRLISGEKDNYYATNAEIYKELL